VRGTLEPGSNGVHALRTRRLVDWIDDELWLVELADDVEEIDDMLVARRGRLLRRIRAWDEDAAREFGESCIWRARDLAAESLDRAGLEREGAALQAEDGLDSLQALAAAEAQSATGAAADALVYLADVVQVSRGGWFETYVGYPGAGATPRRPARSPPTSASSWRPPPAASRPTPRDGLTRSTTAGTPSAGVSSRG
jgi:hypothetical protein